VDYPRLRTPLIAFLVAALCITIVLKGRVSPNSTLAPFWEWARLFLVLVALILGIVGIFSLMDWLSHHAAARIREVNSARTYGMVLIANALKSLTREQAYAVLSLDQTYVSMLAEETGPIFFVRCLARDVPFTFVEEFLERSKRSEPYLWPVREAGNEDYARALTNYIVAKGWADAAQGPFSAKLTKPLPWVAKRFGVEVKQ
jgi:hypothetical protein